MQPITKLIRAAQDVVNLHADHEDEDYHFRAAITRLDKALIPFLANEPTPDAPDHSVTQCPGYRESLAADGIEVVDA